MPRTSTKKSSPKSSAKSSPPPAPPVAETMGDVLTLAEAAAYLRLPEKDVIAAASTQGLPGRLVVGEWRFFKAALQQWLSVSQPTTEMRKAALLASAGAFKDDPDLIEICEAAYRARGRPITEDGSYNVLHGLEPGQ